MANFLAGRFRGAKLAGPGARFILERAEAEIARGAAVRKVFAHERFEVATALALGDMDELMQEQLPVLPTVRADDDAVADGYSPRGVRDDLGAAGGIGQLLILR